MGVNQTVYGMIGIFIQILNVIHNIKGDKLKLLGCPAFLINVKSFPKIQIVFAYIHVILKIQQDEVNCLVLLVCVLIPLFLHAVKN